LEVQGRAQAGDIHPEARHVGRARGFIHRFQIRSAYSGHHRAGEIIDGGFFSVAEIDELAVERIALGDPPECFHAVTHVKEVAGVGAIAEDDRRLTVQG
jgi:hypothetical protein